MLNVASAAIKAALFLFAELMKKFVVFANLIFGLIFARPLNAADLELVAADPQWLALGHYRPQTFGGFESTIDSEKFFLSGDGKVNPRSELEATILLFNQGKDKEKICLFPARHKYLRKAGLVTNDFPVCEEYEQFYRDVSPAGVTLLFTNAYMNNPSSLFGHTLLRVDTSRKGTQMLAHGVNYGAFTGNENSVLFAVYGLTGGYYGGFTVKPYYDIINTYNNIENRDIWELNLDLTPEELDLFMAHIWEVGHTQTRYYFFTENCSYMLLEVLDAVRPSLKLADQFPVQAIPLDTLKAVYSRPELVKGSNYRPSRQNKIKHMYRQMTPLQKEAYVKIISDDIYDYSGLDEKDKGGVLEAAYEYVQYQYVAKNIELKEYREKSFKLLRERAQTPVKGTFTPLTSGQSPLDAHHSMRAGIGLGVRNGGAFQQISYRPAYTSLTDDSFGLLSGAEINFLNMDIRHYDRQNNYVLQNFDIVGIRSLAPVNVMFFPVSYNIQLGINREMNPDNEKEGYALNLTVGGGVSYALNDKVKVYAMLNNHLAYGGFLPHNQWAGIGAAGGIYADYGDWRFFGEAEKIWATSRFADKIKYNLEASYSLNRNWSAALSYTYHDNHGHDLDETMASLRLHF